MKVKRVFSVFLILMRFSAHRYEAAVCVRSPQQL